VAISYSIIPRKKSEWLEIASFFTFLIAILQFAMLYSVLLPISFDL